MIKRSGTERGRANTEIFDDFIVRTDLEDGWAVYLAPNGQRLNRRKVVSTCGFGSSVLRQNPAIKEKLTILEGQLRHRGVLQDTDKNCYNDDIEEKDMESELAILLESLAMARAEFSVYQQEIEVVEIWLKKRKEAQI